MRPIGFSSRGAALAVSAARSYSRGDQMKGEPIPGLSRQPTPAAREALLDPDDTAMLLLDHQTGLFQTVHDVPVPELRNNAMVLANVARLGKAPILYTASEDRKSTRLNSSHLG